MRRAGLGVVGLLGLAAVALWWRSPGAALTPAVWARVEPPVVREGTTPRCAVVGADGATPRWTLDGAAAGEGSTWPGAALRAGQRVGCAVEAAGVVSEDVVLVRGAAEPPRNVLVLLGDDIGADQLQALNPRLRQSSTPVLDGLASQGLLFERAYANPVCSPTRAALLSGRYGRRTGVGTGVHVGSDEPDLRPSELLLPAMLAASPSATWDSSFIGKWHVTSGLDRVWTAPGDAGFRWYTMTPGNLSDGLGEGPSARQDYQRWRKSTNGQAAWVDRYATTDEVDDALARMAAMEPPWLLFVSFHAAHTPLHMPPAALLGGAPIGDTEVAQYRAALRALDTEIGRLLAGMSETTRAQTLVVFLGDNGTSEHGIPEGPLRERAKGTLYEAGVHVPMIVAGAGVTPGRTAGLVDPTDLYATLAELAEVPRPLHRDDGSERITDGVSWLPYLTEPAMPSLRRWAWVELLSPSGCVPAECGRDQAAMIGPRYKLMVSEARRGELVYDLTADPGEERPLRELRGPAAAEVGRMRAEMGRARAWMLLDRPE